MKSSIRLVHAFPLACIASFASFSQTACSAPTGDDDTASSEAAVNEVDGLSITFVGCVPAFAGKAAASGSLAHDGITKCSQDDGSYNVGGYHLDLLSGGEGSDKARTIAGATWFEGKGDEVLTLSRAELERAEGLKVWFGGHSDWVPLADLPVGKSLRCSVKLVGRYVEAEGSYAKHAVLDCEVSASTETASSTATAPTSRALAGGERCASTGQCASGLTCGVTYACIDGCLGSGQPKEAAEACAYACPDVCRSEFLP